MKRLTAAERGTGEAYLPQPREQDILNALVTGAGNKEIAAQMDRSEGTVKVHVSRLMYATGLHSRVQLALWWVKRLKA